MSQKFGAQTTAEEAAAIFAGEIRGKNVLITGASPGGLGAETARVLAKYANLVIIAGRSQEKLDQTVKDIKVETPSANLRTLIIDLNSLASVRKAAAEVNAYSENINTLINNAAVMACPYTKTEDGFESQFGANHLAHFLFTALIFPRIVAASSAASPSRVVNVSSVGHQRSDVRLDDYNFSDGKEYNEWTGYGQSKTANILFANEIARRSKDAGKHVLGFSLHPGGIVTNLSRHVSEDFMVKNGWKNEKGEWTHPGLKTIGQGSSTTIVAAFDPTIANKTGAYLDDARISEATRAGYAASEESGRKLWTLSEELVQEKFEI